MRLTTLALVLACLRLASAAVLLAAGEKSPLGWSFSRFSETALDDRGRAAVVGGSAVLFQHTAAGLVHVLGAGDPVLGSTLADVSPPAVSGTCAAFRALLASGGAILRRCGPAIDVIAQAGHPTPDGRVFAGFSPTVAIGGGPAAADTRLAFGALLDDGTSALFVATGGTLLRVAQTGDPSPPGGTFRVLRLLGVASTGTVAFRAVVTAGKDGIFFRRVTDDAPTVLVVAGQDNFTSVGNGTMNDTEQLAFRASRKDRQRGGSRSGVFRADLTAVSHGVQQVVLEDDPTPLGGTFKAFANSLVPAINASGQIAFRATLDGALFSAGVFLAPPGAGDVVKVVAAAEPTSAGSLVQLRDPLLTDDGDVLVRASRTGGQPGLFRWHAGVVDPLAVLGDPTDIGGGFRFPDAGVRGSMDTGLVLGLREGVFVAAGAGSADAVAVLGDNTRVGGTFAGFDQPVAGPGGRVVFGANVQGPAANRALFLARRRSAVPVLVTGKRVVGGGDIADLPDPPAVGPGCLAVRATLERTKAREGIFLLAVPGGRMTAIARAGDASPLGGTFATFGPPALAGCGRVLFVATIDNGHADGGVFLRVGHQIQVIARVGDDTHSRVGGRFVSFDSPVAAGPYVAFHTVLDQSREAIFVARRRKRGALVGTGDAAPGGGRFAAVDSPTFAGRRVVFHGDLAPIGGGLFGAALNGSVPPADVALPLGPVAVLGAAAPGGGTFTALGPPTGNRTGATGFTADLVGATVPRAVLRLE